MKIGNPFHRISVRYRYLFSFLLMALIPIGMILLFFYHYNINELKKDVDDINLSRVAQIQSSIESELMKHYSLAGALNRDPVFLPLARRGTPVSNYEAMLVLSQYMSYRSLHHATAVLLPEEGRAYTATGVCSADAYFRSILQLDTTQAEILLDTLRERLSGASSAFLPVQLRDGSAFLACAYAIPGPEAEPSAILLSGLDQSQLNSVFTPLVSSFSGGAFILNSQREPIFQTWASGADRSDFWETLLSLDYTGPSRILSIDAGGKKYSILFSYNDRSGLLYGILAEENAALTQVVKQKTLVWQVALLALAICIAAMVFLTLLNYMPVKKLMKLTARSGGGDEYQRIRETLISSSTRAEQLEAVLAQQRPYVLERLLGYALYAEATPEQIDQLFASMDIRPDHGRFFIMCVKALRNPSSQRGYSYFKTVAIDTASAMNCRSCTYYAVERSGEDELVIVANCAEGVSQHSCAGQLREGIESQLSGEYLFTIGVGSVQVRIAELKTSLYEASMLVQSQPERPVSYLEDLEARPDSFANLYPTKDILLFQLQLRQGDESNAQRTFDSLCATAQENCRSLLITRYLYSYIINAIAEVIQQTGSGDFDEPLRKLMFYQTREEFEDSAHLLVADFCRTVNASRRSSNSLLRDRMLAYVRENIANVNLGLENIGEAFDLSPYYVSRFFRDQNNVNLKDYIVEMRLSMAKELLTATEKPVAEIVEQIGYISASSFIRKFKAAEGMTPGEYRNRFRKQPAS